MRKWLSVNFFNYLCIHSILILIHYTLNTRVLKFDNLLQCNCYAFFVKATLVVYRIIVMCRIKKKKINK